jgi:hypothetical protein
MKAIPTLIRQAGTLVMLAMASHAALAAIRALSH